MATETEMRELGYTTAQSLLAVWSDQGAIALEEEVNGGLVAVAHRASRSYTLYICTDAAAWGTLQTFASAEDAEAEAQRILNELTA